MSFFCRRVWGSRIFITFYKLNIWDFVIWVNIYVPSSIFPKRFVSGFIGLQIERDIYAPKSRLGFQLLLKGLQLCVFGLQLSLREYNNVLMGDMRGT